MNIRQLLREARRLPDNERAALAGELRSFDSEIDRDLEIDWSRGDSVAVGPRRLRPHQDDSMAGGASPNPLGGPA